MTTPNYKTNDPHGWCGDPERGAALGRENIDSPDVNTFDRPFVLKRVPIDSSGYDPNGTYFGTADALYWLASEDGNVDLVFLAKCDTDAVAEAAKRYSMAQLPKCVDGMAVAVGDIELDAFTRQYLETALWSSTDESGDSFEYKNFNIEDIAVETVMQAKRDCEAFQDDNEDHLDAAYKHRGYNDESAGHDFWLTRNGHGAGFWDRGLGEDGRELTEASKPYGGVDLYVGDDEKIHG
jgi:hypothetical protein